MLKAKFTIDKKASDEIASSNRIRKFEQLRMKEEFYSSLTMPLIMTLHYFSFLLFPCSVPFNSIILPFRFFLAFSNVFFPTTFNFSTFYLTIESTLCIILLNINTGLPHWLSVIIPFSFVRLPLI